MKKVKIEYKVFSMLQFGQFFFHVFSSVIFSKCLDEIEVKIPMHQTK